jgi:hypothetical protein
MAARTAPDSKLLRVHSFHSSITSYKDLRLILILKLLSLFIQLRLTGAYTLPAARHHGRRKARRLHRPSQVLAGTRPH